MLCVAGWHAGGARGNSEPVIRAAAALEMFHAFALIHDDIIDASDTRRALRGLCCTVAACVAGPCPCSLPRCSRPRDASPSTPHLPGPPGPRPSRSRKTTSTPSAPGPHDRTRGRRCPLPHARVCGRASGRRRSRGRTRSRAHDPRGIRQDSAHTTDSRAQGRGRRPGPAAQDAPVQARRSPRRQAQEGAAEPCARPAPPGTARPRGGDRGHEGVVPRRARRHQPCRGRPLPPDLRLISATPGLGTSGAADGGSESSG
ncbi:polyprenyl synthetase family protein [Streptomyces goshikiensis]|uniref:polyprenyl synthetase family protein n=1 Tax=Streptomyces goshikiensis TaxID=1942 RepID=UPI00371B08FC